MLGNPHRVVPYLLSALLTVVAAYDCEAARGDCSQPLSTGASPAVTDCLFILRAAIGLDVCDPECICEVDGNGVVSAGDALLCLRKATGQNVSCDCPCPTTTTTSTTTTSTTTTTTILPSNPCPVVSPITDLRADCRGVDYRYESPVERVTLVTNGSTLTLLIQDLTGQFPEASVPGAVVTSATTFTFDEVCAVGLGCAPIPPEPGRLISDGHVLCIEFEGQSFCYDWVRTVRALRSGLLMRSGRLIAPRLLAAAGLDVER